MTIDSRPLPGGRSDLAQVAGLRPPSEGPGMEVRIVHAPALERASPCAQRGHPTGAGYPARGELIRIIAWLSRASLFPTVQCESSWPIDFAV